MTSAPWAGVLAGLVLVGCIVFAFRQGSKVKPDPDRRVEDWPNITPPEGEGGAPGSTG